MILFDLCVLGDVVNDCYKLWVKEVILDVDECEEVGEIWVKVCEIFVIFNMFYFLFLVMISKEIVFDVFIKMNILVVLFLIYDIVVV